MELFHKSLISKKWQNIFNIIRNNKIKIIQFKKIKVNLLLIQKVYKIIGMIKWNKNLNNKKILTKIKWLLIDYVNIVNQFLMIRFRF